MKQENTKGGNTFFIPLIVILIALLIVSVPASVFWGTADIAFTDTFKIILNKLIPSCNYDVPAYVERIVWDLRLPRVILGIAVGGGLSICGVAMQALTRNILAEPYILGVSSGASVMAVAVLMFSSASIFAGLGVSGAAFLGALVTLTLVYALSSKRGNASSERLLLSGVAVSMVLNAVTQFLVQVAPDVNSVRNALFWMAGSLAGARWDNILMPIAVSVCAVIFFMFIAKDLNLLSLGDESAVTLGLNVKRIRKCLLIVVSLVTGALVAASGGIGFVGLVIPHIVRLLIGSDHKKVLPLSFLLGSFFLVWADVIARVVFAPKELSIGIITAFCGGPYFIWLLRRKK